MTIKSKLFMAKTLYVVSSPISSNTTTTSRFLMRIPIFVVFGMDSCQFWHSMPVRVTHIWVLGSGPSMFTVNVESFEVKLIPLD